MARFLGFGDKVLDHFSCEQLLPQCLWIDCQHTNSIYATVNHRVVT